MTPSVTHWVKHEQKSAPVIKVSNFDGVSMSTTIETVYNNVLLRTKFCHICNSQVFRISEGGGCTMKERCETRTQIIWIWLGRRKKEMFQWERHK